MRPGLSRGLVAGSLLILSSWAGGAPAEGWIELKAPGTHLTVVTDAGDKSGRKTAFQIVQFERSLQKRFPWIKTDDDVPLVVFVSAEESTVRSLAPDGALSAKDSSNSSYLVASNQNVGALRANLPEPGDKERNPHQAFYQGRVTALLERSLGRSAPLFIFRGLLTFLSDSVVKEKEILVGRMALSDGESTPLPAPAAAEFFREGRAADRKFDLQAGLFVHYLLLGEGGKNAPVLDALLGALALRAPDASVQGALGKVTALYAGFPKYLGSRKFAPMKLPIDPSLGAASMVARPMPPAEALMLRAEILFELNRPVDARGLIRQVRTADPSLARPLEIEAILFEREQRTAESRQAIEGAIQLGSKNGSLYYRLAQLQWSRAMAKPVLQSVQTLLETARGFSPSDASVLAYLAEVQGDLGLYEPARDNAERAAAQAPTELYANMALARAQWNTRKTDAAETTAREALSMAKLASQKQRVQDFLTFVTKNKRAQAGGTKPLAAQFGPPPAGSFGVTRSASSAAGSGRVNLGIARTDSADASALADCFIKHLDGACARAVPALESSCAEKQTTSCVSLGSLYDGGFGVARDRRKAAAYYKSACDLGDKPGCARLAVLEGQGLGVTKNTARATKTLEGLCGEKVPEGCVGLAQILQQTGFAVDRTRARALLKSACEGGTGEACALMTSR